MELKTLNDLDDKYDDQDNCGYSWNVGDVYFELRQVAIGWIIELRKYECGKGVCPPVEMRDFVGCDGHGTENVIGWIMHFFNISKKELVEGNSDGGK